MPWIFLFYTVDKVLEVITVPFAAKALHDLNPVTGVLFPMFWKLIDAAFALAEVMGTNIVQLFIIDMDLSADNLIPYGLESIAAGHGILAGFI